MFSIFQPARLALLVLSVVLYTLPQATAAVTRTTVKLDLLPAAAGVNKFDVDVNLNTLAPTLGVLSDDQVIDLSGVLCATLQVEHNPGQEPRIVGISLDAEQCRLEQTSFQSLFQVATGQLQLDAENWTSQLATPGGFIPVNQGNFAASDMRMVVTGGAAKVSVPSPKPGKAADLNDRAVSGQIVDPLGSAGGITLSQLISASSGSMRQVELNIPLAGLVLQVTNAGLPMSVTFTSGNLRAVGMIPEPTSGLLLAAAAVAMCVAARRQSTKRPL